MANFDSKKWLDKKAEELPKKDGINFAKWASDPITVSYGGGTNSTAMLIGLYEKNLRVDSVIFSDTGGERPDTYVFIDIFNKWLIEHKMPEITFVKHPKETLEENCIKNKVLPSLAYGYKRCSDHFKIRPQWKYKKKKFEAELKNGNRIAEYLGYDAGEFHRMKFFETKQRHTEYPLVYWGWNRNKCVEKIKEHGLPQPKKSSCFFCPAMKKEEIKRLAKVFPELAERAIKIEENADLTSIKGLGRNYAWKDLINADKQQESLFDESGIELICECYDGE